MAADSSILVLDFVSGNYEGDRMPLPPTRGHVVGRSPQADLVLADDAVSRKHARVFNERGRTWLRDLGSRNGTHVNGAAIDLHCLREGDHVVIGASMMRVSSASEADARKLGGAGERRAELEDSSGGSMTGSLTEIGVPDVLQMLATSGKSGVLRIEAPGRAGSLVLDGGNVVDAQVENSPSLAARKALMRLLAWGEGAFRFDSAARAQRPAQMAVPAGHVLMEAAHYQDEIKRLIEAGSLPQPGQIVRLVMPGPTRWHTLEPDLLDLVQDLAEGQTWQQIYDHDDHDDIAIGRRLGALRLAGLVAFE